jgi:hypothetical protein
VVIALILLPKPVWAQFMDSSPGPLAQSHAELEGQDKCGQCHTSGKDLANDKCLNCHDHADQKARIASGKGFHSSTKVAGKRCWDCHSDHHGKGFDIMGWKAIGGRDRFDHNQTDFQLRGKHQAIQCDDCHKRTNKAGIKVYLGEDRQCSKCHRDDQRHGFERSNHQSENFKCERCHSDIAWKPQKQKLEFDHNDKKQANFPLEGAHNDVGCAKCHPQTEFKMAKDTSTCSACHPNVHVGHLFETKACDDCHSPKLGKLAAFRFDHDKRTKFELDGKHEVVSCYQCHKKDVKKKPDKNCQSCHAQDSHHRERFKEFGSPPNCGVCHPDGMTWEPNAFQHNKRTDFELTGSHAKAGCRDCHRGKQPYEWERFKADEVGCMGCHKHKNVHKREHKDDECLNCHKEAGSLQGPENFWKRFHGPRSKFPLINAHAGLDCKKCHAEGAKLGSFKGNSRECGVKCHQDSLHRGSLGDECSRCHVGGIWKALAFNHNKDTDFKLIGNHTEKAGKATCEACHPFRQYKPTPKSCGAEGCHLADDAHKSRLGNKCERCHRETGENIFNHNKQAVFKLTGAHLDVTCKTCHPSVKFKPRPKSCFGCHPEPNVHKNQYGTLCDQCHSTATWENIRPIHDVGNFSLSGSHNKIDCVRCHKDSRPLAGTGNLCITCHREDDIHGNNLGPKCGECHTQWAFAPARFDHTTVGCDLQGQHRAFPCFDCHRTSNFGGLTGDCYGCHRNDSMREATTGGRNGIDNQNCDPVGDPRCNPGAMGGGHQIQFACGTCHRLNSWLPAQSTEDPVFGVNSVCRGGQ